MWVYYKGSKNTERSKTGLCTALFNIYIQKGVDAGKRKMRGIKSVEVQGETVGMLRFADDIALLPEGKQELMIILNEINIVLTTAYGMNINKGKTKALVLTKNGTNANVTLDGSPLDNFN